MIVYIYMTYIDSLSVESNYNLITLCFSSICNSFFLSILIFVVVLLMMNE